MTSRTVRIYKLICNDGAFYFGSTYKSLRDRRAHHEMTSLREDCKTSKVYSHIHKIGWDNVKIELVEERICGTLDERRQLEDSYIRSSLCDPLCLNKNRVIITPEEKYQRSQIANQRLKVERNTPVVCECGIITTVGRFEQHKKSFKHRGKIDKQIPPVEEETE